MTSAGLELQLPDIPWSTKIEIAWVFQEPFWNITWCGLVLQNFFLLSRNIDTKHSQEVLAFFGRLKYSTRPMSCIISSTVTGQQRSCIILEVFLFCRSLTNWGLIHLRTISPVFALVITVTTSWTFYAFIRWWILQFTIWWGSFSEWWFD